MIDGKVMFFYQIFQQLQITADGFRMYPDFHAELRPDVKRGIATNAAFTWIISLSNIIGDRDLDGRMVKLQNQLNRADHFTPEGLARELDNIRDQLVLALSKRKFAYLPPPGDEYFEQEKPFGDLVYATFPEARADSQDAANCIAASLYTASVFHLMRVAEHGLRRMARTLRVTEISKGKKRWNVTEATWGMLLDAVRERLSAAHADSVNNTPKRAAQISILADAAQHSKYMKDLWRDGVSHLETANLRDALNAMGRVGSFMLLAARGVK